MLVDVGVRILYLITLNTFLPHPHPKSPYYFITTFFYSLNSESVNSYAKQLVELDHIVKRMIFESYGLERKKFEPLLESADYVLRGYKYRTPQEGESNLGVAPHSDTAFLTILNQKVEGLGVKLKDGEWFEVDASPSLYLVMGGDAMVVSQFVQSCLYEKVFFMSYCVCVCFNLNKCAKI